MRKLISLLILLSFFSSCDSKIEPKLNNLNGLWVLKSLEFDDIRGNKKIISDSETIIELTSVIATNSKTDGVRFGNQVINGLSYQFEYSVDFSQSKIDILLNSIEKKMLPLDAIGRIQVYSIDIKNSNTFLLTTYIEYDYEKNSFEPKRNVKFTFERK